VSSPPADKPSPSRSHTRSPSLARALAHLRPRPRACPPTPSPARSPTTRSPALATLPTVLTAHPFDLHPGARAVPARRRSNQQLQAMRSTVQAIWPIFDADNSMSIDRQEFLQPDGLADTVIANMGL